MYKRTEAGPWLARDQGLWAGMFRNDPQAANSNLRWLLSTQYPLTASLTSRASQRGLLALAARNSAAVISSRSGSDDHSDESDNVPDNKMIGVYVILVVGVRYFS